MYEVIQHYNAKKRRKIKQCIIGAHPRINPGPLVPKSDTLRPEYARLEITVHTYWTDNLSIGHIRIRKQGKKGNFVIFGIKIIN